MTSLYMQLVYCTDIFEVKEWHQKINTGTVASYSVTLTKLIQPTAVNFLKVYMIKANIYLYVSLLIFYRAMLAQSAVMRR